MSNKSSNLNNQSSCPKDYISKHLMEDILQIEYEISEILNALNEVRKFKIGDILIAKERVSDQYEYVRDSYGIPIKYKVFYVDKNNVPYVRELHKNASSNDRSTGCLLQFGDPECKLHGFKYEIDPDYADAVMLGDEDSYDPLEERVRRRKSRAEITQHNKSIAIKSGSSDDFFKKHVKVGAILWRSNKNYWYITEINSGAGFKKVTKFSRKTGRFFRRNVKLTIKVKTASQKELLLSKEDFRNKIFYTDKPRSYNELHDPKI